MSKSTKPVAKLDFSWGWLRSIYDSWSQKLSSFLGRRPHRSFRKTERSSLPAQPELPGFIAFTTEVWRTMASYKRPMLNFGAILVIINLMTIGLAQQENYKFFTGVIQSVGNDAAAGNFSTFIDKTALLGLAITGGLNGNLSEVQQFTLGLTGLLISLSIVWYLRHRLQGKTVKVRDALYSSGGPILPAVILVLVGLVQTVPALLGVLLYSTVSSAGISGVELMMFAIASGLLILLSLYWLTSTFFAGIIITIPGTYPLKALKLAGDIVIGKRLQLLLRVLWLGLLSVIIWVVVLVPAFFLADAISISWLPIVPVVLQLLGAWSLIFAVTYIYLLYRKMLDEPKVNR